mgnify:CR=1 FL=1
MLVGYGQVNQYDENPGSEPVDLMEAAAREAADARVLEAVDAVRIVNLLSVRYRDPGLLLAQRIGIQGVPFFVLDRRYGVSGAQPAEVLVQALQKAAEPAETR